MAIVLEQTVTGADGGSGITLTSWTPGSNELCLLFIAQRNETLTPSVSGNGLTWVEITSVDNSQGQNGISVWRAMGASPSTGSISVTNTSGFDVAVACRFSGVDTSGTNGSGAIDASQTAPGPPVTDDDDMQLSINTVTNNAMVLFGGTHRNSTFSTPGDQTTVSINNTNGTGGDTTTLSTTRKTVATAGATTMGGTNVLSAARDWCCAAIAIKPVGGTAYNQNVSGSLTPSAALLKSTTKKPAGSITPTGAVTKRLARTLAGAITPTGALVKQALKILAGTVSSSGALTAQKLIYKALDGTVGVSGALLRASTKVLTGSLTSSATLTKRLTRALAGTVDSSGALTAQRLIFIVLSGTVGSSGALAKQIGKSLSGTVGASGALAKTTLKTLAGALTPVGSVARAAVDAIIRQRRRGTIYQQNKLAFLVTAPPWSNSGYATDHTQDVTGYDHTHAALGGFWSANLTMRLPLHDLEDWLQYGVGRQVQVKGRGTKTAWEGIVNRVTVNVGGYNMTVGPYLDIANKVKLAYSIFLQLGGGNATGIRVVTEPTSNLASQSKYGILAKVFSVGGIDSSAVAGLQAMLLERYSQPPRSEDLNLPGETGLRYIDLKLECIGYAHLFQKYTYSSTTAGTQNLSAKLAAIVAAEPNALFSSSIATNTIQVPAAQTDDAEAWGLIKAMIAMGDTSLNRYTFGVYENRRVTYKAVDNSVVYVRPLREGASVIQDAQGGLLQPWEVRPGSYVLVTDLLPGKPVASDLNAEQRAIFADTVQYRMPDSLVINGAHAFRIEQRMAQMGLSGVS